LLGRVFQRPVPESLRAIEYGALQQKFDWAHFDGVPPSAKTHSYQGITAVFVRNMRAAILQVAMFTLGLASTPSALRPGLNV
jgi:hypothetical protein